MPSAFVLVNVESGSESNLLNQIKNVEGVKESYVSYGVYDLILKVEAESMEKLKDIITHKIRTISNVRSTLSLIMMDE
jgi:DNA-binding Lrp family transcriptional regulator